MAFLQRYRRLRMRAAGLTPPKELEKATFSPVFTTFLDGF